MLLHNLNFKFNFSYRGTEVVQSYFMYKAI